jgi:hypothetical protein
LAHVFGSKSFVLNFLRSLKSASRFSVKVFGKQAASFGKVGFCGKSYFLQSQVSKIGFKVLAKVSVSLVRAFKSSLFFLAKSTFCKVSF